MKQSIKPPQLASGDSLGVSDMATPGEQAPSLTREALAELADFFALLDEWDREIDYAKAVQ